MNLNHTVLSVFGELTDFSQAQYEIYHRELRALTRNDDSAANANGAVVRAALKAQFLILEGEQEVDKLKPAAVVWLTRKIDEHVRMVVTPPAEEDKKK